MIPRGQIFILQQKLLVHRPGHVRPQSYPFRILERVKYLAENTYLVFLFEGERLGQAEILAEDWIAELIIGRQDQRAGIGGVCALGAWLTCVVRVVVLDCRDKLRFAASHRET